MPLYVPAAAAGGGLTSADIDAVTDSALGWPDIVCAVNPRMVDSVAAISGGANAFQLQRVVVPKAGTIRELAVFVSTASGNVAVAIYSPGSTHNRVYASGSVACPSAGGWKTIADANYAVTAGQVLDLCFSCDNATAVFGRTVVGQDTVAKMPTEMTPSGQTNILWAYNNTGAFPPPDPVTTLFDVSSFNPVVGRLA